ncbi:hypothetical protein ZHAS_00007000 [Anopheles sinensis]|uniref:Uncharacterized protein n=1 Tax=Anopheles sinensis TaxID=74873 RepID=A0A084VNF9_ANOSI|nr:hypothetical protein ZHAS_00007000 [Anopheles sinensis]
MLPFSVSLFWWNKLSHPSTFRASPPGAFSGYDEKDTKKEDLGRRFYAPSNVANIVMPDALLERAYVKYAESRDKNRTLHGSLDNGSNRINYPLCHREEGSA